jgi:hypothetical protein
MRIAIGIAAVLAVAGTAAAVPTLQMDLNAFHTQAVNSGGGNTAFGGLSHTGAVQFSVGSGLLAGVYRQDNVAGPFMNQNFAGFTLSGFTGQINLVNGMVTGGNMLLTLNNGDTFTTAITPGVGAVSTFVGGGFKIEALTRQGFFNDSTFGNVNVTDWFANQGVGGLIGSLLQFNFDPNATGFASSDMDLFIDAQIIPLPPAAWTGLATLIGVVGIRRLRRS